MSSRRIFKYLSLATLNAYNHRVDSSAPDNNSYPFYAIQEKLKTDSKSNTPTVTDSVLSNNEYAFSGNENLFDTDSPPLSFPHVMDGNLNATLDTAIDVLLFKTVLKLDKDTEKTMDEKKLSQFQDEDRRNLEALLNQYDHPLAGLVRRVNYQLDKRGIELTKKDYHLFAIQFYLHKCGVIEMGDVLDLICEKMLSQEFDKHGDEIQEIISSGQLTPETLAKLKAEKNYAFAGFIMHKAFRFVKLALANEVPANDNEVYKKLLQDVKEARELTPIMEDVATSLEKNTHLVHAINKKLNETPYKNLHLQFAIELGNHMKGIKDIGTPEKFIAQYVILAKFTDEEKKDLEISPAVQKEIDKLQTTPSFKDKMSQLKSEDNVLVKEESPFSNTY